MRRKALLSSHVLWLLPFVAYFLHSLLFAGWIIDDAGISFAYARNLAAGQGLVAQPGAEPVEGFSNFLWVLFLSPFFRVGVFHPTLTPKVLSALLVFITFILIERTFRLHSDANRTQALLVLTLLAFCTPFVIWTSSGLENALYVSLLCLALYLTVRHLHNSDSLGNAFMVGVTTAAIAMTRPDGLVYVPAFPLVAVVTHIRWRPTAKSHLLQSLLVYLASFGAVFGIFLVLRRIYFGVWLPNTFYAKGGPGTGDILSLVTLQPTSLVKTLQLMEAVAGPLAGLLSALLVAATLWVAARGHFGRQHVVWLVFMLAAASAFILLPNDWMPEYRFATPFFVFLYSFCVLIAGVILRQLRLPNQRRHFAAQSLALLGVGLSTTLFAGRSIAFGANPPASFQSVSEIAADFDRYAEELGIENGSVLTPDIGGMLYYSRLRIYDMAGLSDKTIARTLHQYQSEFYDYIFDFARPSFVHIHSYWTMAARLDQDPRFRHDYIPLHEYMDPWVLQRSGLRLYSGDFVRRELCEDQTDVVRRLQAELAK